MNIQIFGTKKCNATRKAERFFKGAGVRWTPLAKPEAQTESGGETGGSNTGSLI